MFFDSWIGLLLVLLVGSLAYAALILILSVSGKRTLTKLSAFDLFITVALGSTLSWIILTKSVAFFEGILVALLICLQYLITWLPMRSRRFQKLFKAEPTLLLNGGEFVHSAMRRQRLTTDDVLAAVRAEETGDITEVAAIVLKTDVSISVVRHSPLNGSLSNVAEVPEQTPSAGRA